MCHPDEFQCQGDGSCIPKTWECDRHSDCIDGSDEHNGCVPKTCSPSHFLCDNGNCIYKSWRCDGDNDCRDMSDEKDCPTPPFHCPFWQWQCPGYSTCVSLSVLCDGNFDCPNGTDESPLCRYQLANDSKTCEDINECDSPGFCSQHCINMRGSFRCTCDAEYTLESDGRSCKVTGSENLLLVVASRDKIIVDNITAHVHNIYSLVQDVSFVVALDFDSVTG
ncbi:hypothetical protein A6R68_22481, partial [Neotoma lepida]